MSLAANAANFLRNLREMQWLARQNRKSEDYRKTTPKAEFINSVSGGFGLINFCKEFGLAAIAFEQFPGRPFAKLLEPELEFMNSVSGGFGLINFCKVRV